MDDYTQYGYMETVHKFKNLSIDGNELVDFMEVLDIDYYTNINT